MTIGLLGLNYLPLQLSSTPHRLLLHRPVLQWTLHSQPKTQQLSILLSILLIPFHAPSPSQLPETLLGMQRTLTHRRESLADASIVGVWPFFVLGSSFRHGRNV